MAFTNSSSGSGRQRGGLLGRRRGAAGSLSEMNVVPLVDVVLVLLIIFMITASAMEFGLEIEVPEVRSSRSSAVEHPVISIDRGGSLYLNDKGVNINELGEAIRTRFKDEKDVYLRADKNIRVEQYLQVVDALGQAGFKVSLVTKTADISKGGR